MELELQQQEPQPERRRKRKIKAWIVERYSVRSDRDHYMWRIATGGTAFFGSLSMLAAVFGMPTGLGTVIDIILFLSLNAIAMTVAAILVSLLLSMAYIPIPRRFAAVWLYAAVETYIIMYFAEFGIWLSIIGSVVFMLIGSIAGCLLGLLLRMKIKSRSKVIMAIVMACTAAALLVTVIWNSTASLPVRAGSLDVEADDGIEVAAIHAVNPAEYGRFEYSSFTYGSGKDKHRTLFGDEVDVETDTVDASAYITEWSGLKTRFWGFDEHKLPLNGRVWMPEGEGTFPLALIVHGNHLMESFSDGGYAYLGELLASKGIIAVSVDENFLNYSVWSGIPNHDMKMRAWVLLKHLQQIQQLNERIDNPFTNHVDFENIALIGHSRGGQAVAMAADADRWFKEDKTLASLSDINIKSVIAIAPTDKQVDDKSARLSEVNYLTLQGARDGDVNNFYGERQYSRTTFKQKSEKFKAALYIADANHSQFNTDWGIMDERPPGGLFLNRKGMLDGEEQRQVSKVYVSAFLQATLLGEDDYKALFRDYRTGLSWLPDTEYTNRYEEANFTEIARYEEDSSKTTLQAGGAASVKGMVEWQEAYAKDRDGNNKGTKGIELEWSESGASYELNLSPKKMEQLASISDANLVFSMANLERDLMATDEIKEEDEKNEDKKVENEKVENEEGIEDKETVAESGGLLELPPLPQVEIKLTTNDGKTRELVLADIMPVQPSIYTAFMSFSWLEERVKDEKYTQANEPVFQTYVLPIDKFGSTETETPLAVEDISQITFHFINGPGKVMLDDIGFMS